MDNLSLYEDIKARTGGEIYLGIVGPVRTGKSTFIRQFMNLSVIPSISDPNEKRRVIDELPQAGVGKTVMTTEPKFIPKYGIEIPLSDTIKANFRLIDCVGFVTENAQGIYEDENERLVKTPWSNDNIPFSKAAEIGTEKVIRDHSTIGIVITTDGSIGEFTRESYINAETRAIEELKKINKPFIIIVNSIYPESDYAKNIAEEIQNKFDVTALSIDCEKMTKNDIRRILSCILDEFPIELIEFHFPAWIESLPSDNPIKDEIIQCSSEILHELTYIKNISQKTPKKENQYITSIKYDKFNFTNGVLGINFCVNEKLYYAHLSNIIGETIEDEYALINILKRLSKFDHDFNQYIDAFNLSKQKGYGVVVPTLDEITLYEPEITKTGNKYGVKIKAESPSIHLIKVKIGTEISPIVGSKEQAEDLLEYIKESKKDGNVWDTNIFGKTIGDLVEEGINTKIHTINDDCQVKLMDTMQKVINETSNGIVCLII